LPQNPSHHLYRRSVPGHVKSRKRATSGRSVKAILCKRVDTLGFFLARFPRCAGRRRRIGESGSRSCGSEVAPRTLPKIWRRSGCVWDDPCSAHLHMPPRPTKSGSLRSLRLTIILRGCGGYLGVMDSCCGFVLPRLSQPSLNLYCVQKHHQPPQRWLPCFGATHVEVGPTLCLAFNLVPCDKTCPGGNRDSAWELGAVRAAHPSESQTC
jgi:hypothetical protein